MPIAMGLLGKDGNDLTFAVDANDVAHVLTENQHTAVLNLKQATQSFVFNNVQEKPVASLLRGFSAPVKLNFRNNPG